MDATLVRGKGRKKFVVLAGVVLSLLLIASVIATVTGFARQQDRDSLLLLKNEQLKTLVDARSQLQPAANTYVNAYKKAHLAAGSRDKAEQDSKKEHDAFKQAEASARDAMGTLKAGRGISEGQVSESIAQYEDSYVGFVDYMAGMVDSYPQFHALFGERDNSCQGIFIGGRAVTLSERAKLLIEAASECRSATDELAKSKNSTYVEYALRLANRVSQLEVDAAATATAEKEVESFTSQADQLTQKSNEALNRNASAEELLKIADELKNMNARIKANQSAFDYASKRYLSTVKEMPSLLDDVFSKHVPDEVKYYDTVIPARLNVLEAVMDDELVE